MIEYVANICFITAASTFITLLHLRTLVKYKLDKYHPQYATSLLLHFCGYYEGWTNPFKHVQQIYVYSDLNNSLRVDNIPFKQLYHNKKT